MVQLGIYSFHFFLFFLFFFLQSLLFDQFNRCFFFWISFLFSLVLIYKMTERNLWQFVWCQSDYIKYWLYQLLLSAFFVPINLSLMTVTCHSIPHCTILQLLWLHCCIASSWAECQIDFLNRRKAFTFFSFLPWNGIIRDGWLTFFFFFFCFPFPSWLALELKAPPESMQHTYKYTNAAEKIALHFVNYALWFACKECNS